MAPGRGEGGIRTPDAGITDVTVFETAAFNHSATSPGQSVSSCPCPFNHVSPSTIVVHNPLPRSRVHSDSADHLTSCPRTSTGTPDISGQKTCTGTYFCDVTGPGGPHRLFV